MMSTARGRRMVKWATALVTSATLAAAGLVALPLAASADTAPAPGDLETVSADGLPTWQINGVAWSQVLVGNTVYVAGNFTRARPPGVAAGGAGEVAANHLFAYDITTGNRVASFAPQLNGQALSITVSPDKSRIYVGGDFTTVNGLARNKVASFVTATGALDTSFAPNVNNQVRALAATNSTLYIGGNYQAINGSARKSLGAVDARTGALRPWAPGLDDGYVWSMTTTPDQARVVVGGSFTTMNGGQSANGMASIDGTSGQLAPWAATQYIRNGGKDSAINALKADGRYVYGSGYAFGTGNFEGTFAADPSTGEIKLVNDCHGDTYDVAPIGDILYSVSHTHDCTWVGGMPDTNPRVRWQNALAQTITPTTTNIGPDNYGWNYDGLPGSTILHWFPSLAFGSYTSSRQAAWSVTGNADYVAMGGEFPRVNGTAQQGLTRMARKELATNKRGPSYSTTPARPVPATVAQSFSPGTIRVSFGTAWDMDNEELTYEVLRNNAATPVYTTKIKTNYWTLPSAGFVDTNVTAGQSYTYQVRISDPFGNILWSPRSAAVSPATTDLSSYAKAVIADGAKDFWRFGETSGTSVFDYSGFDDMLINGNVGRGADGAINADPDKASTFDGNNTFAATQSLVKGPDVFSVEAWIKTTSTTGGKIVGFGDQNTGTSSNYDRHAYMDPQGRITFGVYNNGTYTVNTSKAYNDGEWHHIVGTMDAGGVTLYVDGKRVGKNTGTSTAQPYSGYWRVGGDSPWAGAAFFNGTIDDVAIYDKALTADQVVNHYVASGRTSPIPPKPTDAYGAAVYTSQPDFYWRLDETAGTDAADATGNDVTGLLRGGYSLGDGSPLGVGKALSLGGSDGAVASSARITGPSVYSQELWFKTTTTSGGKLIGFGNEQTGTSGAYDRHVWMRNNGQLSFGTYTGQVNVATSPKSYNDGVWHHLVSSQGPDGMKLYVDGELVATNSQTQAQPYEGYWRVGGDNLGGWNGDNSSNYFAGSIDEVAVYSTVLSASRIQQHFSAGGGQVAPTATFTWSATGLDASFDGSSSSDDGQISEYAWTFGDGGTSTEAAPTHRFGTPGTYTVQLTVTDDQGLTGSTSQQVTIKDAPLPKPVDDYGVAVYDTQPDLYWRLDETSGTTARDTTANQNDARIFGGVSLGANGALGGSDTAATFDGVDGLVSSQTAFDNPTVFSQELWFSTTTQDGGKLIGFGRAQSGGSGSFDRHVYMTPDGKLNFGAWTGTANVATTDTSYNDGRWHQVVSTLGPDGMKLYVDGQLAATNPNTQAEPYTGYWRVGGDNSWGGNPYFAGTIDEVAVYSKVLSPQTVLAHFEAAGGQLPNDLPTAAFEWNATGLQTAFDGTESSDPDGSITAYSWDFGDGSTSTEAKPTYTYAQPGSYTVTLTVTDNRGATGVVTRTVGVQNLAPIAAFTSTPDGLRVAFDGTESRDPDGSITGYSWDFGDGSTSTEAKPTYTYAQPGSYTVTLTVTDNRGASDGESKVIGVENRIPTATFTSGTDALTASFDARASGDADGAIVSYAWDFGDGATGTGSTASHTYPAAGTYPVSLTVTDNAGGTATSTGQVSVAPANQVPTAQFTATTNGLKVDLNGSSSTDPDGTISSYAWDFGDGTQGSGVTTSKTYGGSGTYTIRLTVQDNRGGTGTTTQQVVVTAPVPVAVAADTFNRTVANGWGNADTGGAWTTSNTAANFAVGGGTGRITIPSAGATRSIFLNSVTSSDADVQVRMTVDRTATGGGTYLSTIGRRVAGQGDYRAKVRYVAGGGVRVSMTHVSATNTETTIVPETAVPGVTVTPGEVLNLRFQVTGTGTTALRAKVWKAGAPEPASWLLSGTSTLAGMQVPGSFGFVAYLSSSSTNAPHVASFSGYTVSRASALP